MSPPSSPRRVAQLEAEHLESAAHAQDRRPGPGGSHDLVGQALRPQVAQAGCGVRAAGQDDRVVGGQGRASPDRRDRYTGRVDERIEAETRLAFLAVRVGPDLDEAS